MISDYRAAWRVQKKTKGEKMFDISKLQRGSKGSMSLGAVSYNSRFGNKIVVVSSANDMTFTQRALDELGNPEYVEFFYDEKVFAFKACANRQTGYHVSMRSKKSSEATKYITLSKYIKELKIPKGYYFEGVKQGEYIVFSRTPNGQA